MRSGGDRCSSVIHGGPASRILDIPLYCTGLTEVAKICVQEGLREAFRLNRDSSVKLPVSIPANGYEWIIIE